MVPGPQGDGLQGSGLSLYSTKPNLLYTVLAVQVVPSLQGDGLQGSDLSPYSASPNPPVRCAGGARSTG